MRFEMPEEWLNKFFDGVATTLGSGVYALIAVAAHDHAGPSVVLSILMAAVTSCLGGLCYSEVVTRFPKGGSAYSYMYATVGEVFAFFVGWCMLVEYAFGTALAAKACSQYLDVALDGKMSHLLQQHLGHIRVKGLDTFLDLPSIPVMLIACIIFIVSFKALCTLNNIFVVINLLVICGTVVIGIFNMDSENWIAGLGFFPGGINGIFSAASLCYFAFVGYDVIAIFTRGVPHRSHTFPSIVSTVFIIGLLGAFSIAIVLTLLIPFSMLEVQAPLVQAFDLRQVIGMKYFVTFGAICGLTSATIASLMSLIKIIESLSSDGLLFKFLSRNQCRSLIAAISITFTLSLVSDIKTLVHVLGMGTLVSSIAVAICVLCTRYGADPQLMSPLNMLELAEEESAIDTTKPFQDQHLDLGEKELVQDTIRSKPGYGSLHSRSLSVDFVDESYITCLSELSPHWTKQEPSQRSAATVASLIGAAVLVMLLMGVMTLHVPRLLPKSKWWTELVACGMFVVIVAFAAAICRQPKHKPRIHNRVPCVPFLPLCSIWMDVHLIVGLPNTAWLFFFIWSLFGALLYLSYGIWNSSEREFQDHQGVNLLNVPEDCSDSDKEIGDQNVHQVEGMMKKAKNSNYSSKEDINGVAPMHKQTQR
ncbi:high affinity cationic amino acid transporter 1 [Trichonephila clavata]|uniref:High affinity cationic amino acid transporter 1 n=1 Tax=Trichonephila clavata TaxID=2740835 RepID=A0A8X6IXV8_TRICU|nr:high affinity cationic amino acid transporter 1 [Trichonephila clavata]